MKGWVVALISIVSFVVGLFVGINLVSGIFAGAGAASGLIYGSQAGVCLTVETAKDMGVLPPEQANKLIANTMEKIRGKTKSAKDSGIKWIDQDQDCAEMVKKMLESAKAQ
jgi:hypothetical protein